MNVQEVAGRLQAKHPPLKGKYPGEQVVHMVCPFDVPHALQLGITQVGSGEQTPEARVNPATQVRQVSGLLQVAHEGLHKKHFPDASCEDPEQVRHVGLPSASVLQVKQLLGQGAQDEPATKKYPLLQVVHAVVLGQALQLSGQTQVIESI